MLTPRALSLRVPNTSRLTNNIASIHSSLQFLELSAHNCENASCVGDVPPEGVKFLPAAQACYHARCQEAPLDKDSTSYQRLARRDSVATALRRYLQEVQLTTRTSYFQI